VTGRRVRKARRRGPSLSLVPAAVVAALGEMRNRVTALEAQAGRIAAVETALGEVAADVASLHVHLGALLAVSGRAEAQKRAAGALARALEGAGVLKDPECKEGGGDG